MGTSPNLWFINGKSDENLDSLGGIPIFGQLHFLWGYSRYNWGDTAATGPVCGMHIQKYLTGEIIVFEAKRNGG